MINHNKVHRFDPLNIFPVYQTTVTQCYRLIFFEMGQSRPHLIYFRLFHNSIIGESVDGVHRSRTRGSRMESADESTELRRHQLMWLIVMPNLSSNAKAYTKKFYFNGSTSDSTPVWPDWATLKDFCKKLSNKSNEKISFLWYNSEKQNPFY